MTAPTIAVAVELHIAQPTDFILDDAVRGVLDGTDYVLASGLTPVTSDATSVSIRRGRFSQLWDAVDAGSCQIVLNNEDRDFDPTHGASPYVGQLVPGRRTQVTANGVAIWSGFIDDYDLSYDVSGRSVADVQCYDSIGALGMLEFDAWTSSTLSAPDKLRAVAARPEVAWSDGLDLDAGVEALVSDSVTWGSSVLNYCQLIARSDLGFFFAAADGRLAFRNRTSTAGVAPVASFGGSGIPFAGVAAATGSEVLFSKVGVDREGGTGQSATVTSPETWRQTYGPLRSLKITGLLLSTDAQSQSIADYLLSKYDTPRYRITEITVLLHGLETADQNTALAVDLGDVVSVEFTPNDVGDPIVQNLMVQGIRHDISAAQTHAVTFALTDNSEPYFRLDDATYGVLDDDVLAF